ncbi:hypothetical protein SE92_10980 [Bradyrhizobium sp. AT1]|nr:hypothetical protein SE92_10980 [Bradyrhizobium sp. AT1]
MQLRIIDASEFLQQVGVDTAHVRILRSQPHHFGETAGGFIEPPCGPQQMSEAKPTIDLV